MDEAAARSPSKGGRDQGWIDRIKAEKRAKEGLHDTGHNGGPSMEKEERQIPANLVFVWDAFSALSRSRDYGEIAPRPIKPSEVVAYCDIRMLGGRHREDLFELIQLMDLHFVTRRTKEAEERLKKEEDERKRRSKQR